MIDHLKQPRHMTQKAKLTLLTFCNSLLRRLSKTNNTNFSGRIILLMTVVVPLDDRSGLNVTGRFNIDNVTSIKADGAGDGDS